MWNVPGLEHLIQRLVSGLIEGDRMGQVAEDQTAQHFWPGVFTNEELQINGSNIETLSYIVNYVGCRGSGCSAFLAGGVRK